MRLNLRGSGFEVLDLRFGIQGVGGRVLGAGLRVPGVGFSFLVFRVSGARCGVRDFGCGVVTWLPNFGALGPGFNVFQVWRGRVGWQFGVPGFGFSGFGLRISGARFRVSGIGFQIPGSGFRVSGFRCQVPSQGFRDSGFDFWGLGLE